MDIIDIIKSRRSVRKFSPDLVSDELVDRILEAGRWAPSGRNNQPWRFAEVMNRDKIKEISALTHYSKIVLAAQALIPVFLDTAAIYHRDKDIQTAASSPMRRPRLVPARSSVSGRTP